MCDEATYLRADLHEVKGRAKQQAREMRDMLRLAQSAIKSGRGEVAEQRRRIRHRPFSLHLPAR